MGMNWIKKQSGPAASITCETHGAHRSIESKDSISVTVYRTKPSFKDLGSASGFKEAIAMCEADKKAATPKGSG